MPSCVATARQVRRGLLPTSHFKDAGRTGEASLKSLKSFVNKSPGSVGLGTNDQVFGNDDGWNLEEAVHFDDLE